MTPDEDLTSLTGSGQKRTNSSVFGGFGPLKWSENHSLRGISFENSEIARNIPIWQIRDLTGHFGRFGGSQNSHFWGTENGHFWRSQNRHFWGSQNGHFWGPAKIYL